MNLSEEQRQADARTWRAVYCAALTALIARGGKRDPDSYVDRAAAIAERTMTFYADEMRDA